MPLKRKGEGGLARPNSKFKKVKIKESDQGLRTKLNAPSAKVSNRKSLGSVNSELFKESGVPMGRLEGDLLPAQPEPVSKASSTIVEELLTALRSQDISNVVSRVQEFIARARESNEEVLLEGEDEAIAEVFLKSDESCSEIFLFLDWMNQHDQKNDHSRSLMFQILEIILLHVGSQLEKETLSTSIVKKVLSTESENMYRLLVNNFSKYDVVKSTIKLLTVMAAVAPSEVILGFSLSKSNLTKLMHKRHSRDPFDIRTCIVHFVVAFLVVGDVSVIKTLCQEQNFVNSFFVGLILDREPVISLFLTTLQKKVVENPHITKTLKVRVFSKKVLNEIAQLFDWEGPKIWSSSHFKGPKVMKKLSNTVPAKEKEAVKSVAKSILMALCCDFKNGILFKECREGGTKGNPNHIMTDFLKSIKTPFSNQDKVELITKILIACPEQLIFYLPSLKEAFSPRPSPLWSLAMKFLINLIREFEHAWILEEVRDLNDLPNAEKRMLTLMGCSMFANYDASTASKREDKVVVLTILKLLNGNIQKLKSILDNLAASTRFPEHEQGIIANALKEAFWKNIPSPITTANIYVRTFLLEEIAKTTVRSLEVVLSFLFHCFELFPLQSMQESLPFRDILKNIKKLGRHAQFNDTTRMQLIKLMSSFSVELEVSEIMSQEKEDNHFYFLLESYVLATNIKDEAEVVKMVINFLGNNNIVISHQKEIELWLAKAKTGNESYTKKSIFLLWKAIQAIAKNPTKFEDEAVEVVFYSDLEVNSQGRLDFHEAVKIFERTTSPFLEESLIARSHFSPLLPAAIEVASQKSVREALDNIHFLETVLTTIFNWASQPISLCRLIMKHPNCVGTRFVEYVSMWLEAPSKRAREKAEAALTSESGVLDPSDFLMALFTYYQSPGRSLDLDFFYQLIDGFQNESLAKRPLLQESLFLLQKQLHDVKIGKDPEGALVLLQFLEKAILNVQGKGPLLPNGDTIENCPNDQEITAEVLKHSMFIQWFLCNKELEPGRSVDACIKAVTKLTLKVIRWWLEKRVQTEEEGFSLILEPYAIKLTQFVEALCNEEMQERKEWRLAKEAISVFAESFEAKKIVGLMNVVDRYVLKTLESSSAHNLLANLFRVYSNLLQKPALKLRTVQALFAFPPLGSDERKEKMPKDYQSLYYLLNENPTYGFALDTEDAVKLLDSDCPWSRKIVIYLSRFFPNHRTRFKKWLKDKPAAFGLWPFPLMVPTVMVLLCQNEMDDQEENYKLLKLAAPMFWEALSNFTFEKDSQTKSFWGDTSVSQIFDLMSLKNLTDITVLKTIATRIHQGHRNKVPSMARQLVLLQVLGCSLRHKLQIENGVRGEVTIVDITLHWLVSTLHCYEQNPEQGLDHLQCIESLVKNITPEALTDFFVHSHSWDGFVHSSLGYAFKETTDISRRIVALVSELVKKLYCKSTAALSTISKPSLIVILSVITQNPDLKMIWFEKKSENTLKDCVADLLILLVSIEGTVCKAQDVPFILGGYFASLSSSDQKTLHLLWLYQLNGVSLFHYTPFYWGSDAVINFGSQAAVSVTHLRREPKIDDIINILDSDTMRRTVHNFPLHLPLLPISTDAVDLRIIDIYDPRFLLPVMIHLLEPGKFVSCYRFMRSGCFSLSLAALCSNCHHMRAAAYTVLSKFYQQMESSDFYDQFIFTSFLELLGNAFYKDNSKLPNIVAHFYIAVLETVLNPGSIMYEEAFLSLAKQSSFIIDALPTFTKIFLSHDLKHTQHRLWMLSIATTGFQSSSDFNICQRHHVFSAVCCFAHSTLSTIEEKIAVVKLLQSALKVRIAAYSLYRDESLLAWIKSIASREQNDDLTSELVKVMYFFWETSLTMAVTKDPNEEKQPQVFKGKDGQANSFASEAKPCHPFSRSFPLDFLLAQFSLLETVKNLRQCYIQRLYLETLYKALSYSAQFEAKLSSLLRPSHVRTILRLAEFQKEEAGLETWALMIATQWFPVLKSPSDAQLVVDIFRLGIFSKEIPLSLMAEWLLLAQKESPALLSKTLIQNRIWDWSQKIMERYLLCTALFCKGEDQKRALSKEGLFQCHSILTDLACMKLDGEEEHQLQLWVKEKEIPKLKRRLAKGEAKATLDMLELWEERALCC